ncbi:MAG: MarR family winged helix-turn-helix transcriptional regulator [Gemella sp.]|nr:MarR family winged helix-turn-helix transcriptional regulator [Gemella sp.]
MSIISKERTAEIANELVRDLFKYILYIQEKQLQHGGSTLSVTEVHLLEAVVNSGENNTVTNIAKTMLITKSTFSINASKLIKKGYLTKSRDEQDGRIVRVEITEKAKETLALHDKYHNILGDKLLEKITEEESIVLNKSLGNVLEHLKEEYKKILERDNI